MQPFFQSRARRLDPFPILSFSRDIPNIGRVRLCESFFSFDYPGASAIWGWHL
jgi:hypothetical protein